MAERFLVTGACGFFGHHVVEHLLKHTTGDIVALDKLSYASRGYDRLRDIGAYDDTRVTRLNADLSAKLPDGMIYEIGNVDYVLHLAAETHVDNSIKDPRPFVYSNVLGTFELLDLAATRLHPKLFVYFSTDEVFGPSAMTQKEFDYSHNPKKFFSFGEWDRYNSTNPYSATKAGGEELALAYANTYGLPVLVTHCMNLFGERQHPEKFIPHVIRKVLAGETVYIHSDKERVVSGKRSYIHARNAADAVLYLLRKLRYEDGHRDKYNIPGDHEMSNLELAQFIAEHLDRNLRYELVDFHSSRPGHDLRYSLDGTKLALRGWKSPVPFLDSLRKTIDWSVLHSSWLNK